MLKTYKNMLKTLKNAQCDHPTDGPTDLQGDL